MVSLSSYSEGIILANNKTTRVERLNKATPGFNFDPFKIEAFIAFISNCSMLFAILKNCALQCWYALADILSIKIQRQKTFL